MEKALPPIPAKRYFTIGEVGDLCGVKPYVLRYWEQEFTQLRPMKRRGNRRYYQHHEVLMIRRIRELLYEQGFTISGARNQLQELAQSARELRRAPPSEAGNAAEDEWGDHTDATEALAGGVEEGMLTALAASEDTSPTADGPMLQSLRRELLEIRKLLAD